MTFFRKLFRRSSSDSNQPATAVDESPAPSLEAAPVPVLTAPEPSAADSDNLDPDGTRDLHTGALPHVSAMTSTRGLAAWAARDVGRVRSSNQDQAQALVMNLRRAEGDVPLGLFVVADGMGGHEGGEIASRLAVETIVISVLEQLVLPALADEEPIALQTLMIAAVQEANARIWQTSRQLGNDMGTTCTAVLLLGNGLYITHVGDSRAYLLSGGELRQLTVDHSTVGRLIQLGQLSPEEASEHPLRNQLYRTVGQHPEVQVDFVYQPVESATHLLLCSDGLWGMVPAAEIAAILEETLWPEDACRRLIARANMLGGEDNISAVVVSLPSMG